ncbi:exodeoxyribonuclease VII large subunit [Tomitella gaofuii]|uniref:exodeoxyribonuclease VII large subunit n=1 Tax=Tomitella gaofuii TaxID=2760083 RepID=UPI0015FD3674|nr:exodeoxyribonuclease VII large subunit [Tomitella gaofuii]
MTTAANIAPEARLPHFLSAATELDAAPLHIDEISAEATRSLKDARSCLRGEIRSISEDSYKNLYAELMPIGTSRSEPLSIRIARRNRDQLETVLSGSNMPDLEELLVCGRCVTVAGVLAVNTRHNAYFDVHGISSHSAYPGPALRALKGHIEFLREHGVDERRLSTRFEYDKQMPGDTPIRNVTILAARDSHAYDDFAHSIAHLLRTRRVVLTRRTVRMEGDGAAEEISAALAAITADDADAVVVVRGGGGTNAFRPFDDPILVEEVIHHPLPVVTGLGHARNVTSTDRAAFAAFSTPTAVGEALRRAVYGAEKRERVVRYGPPRAARDDARPKSFRSGPAEQEAARVRQLNSDMMAQNDRLRLEKRTAENDVASVQARYRHVLHTMGLRRIRTLSRIRGWAWAAPALVATGIALGVPEAAGAAAITAVCCALVAVFLWRGPLRAVRPARRPETFASHEQWEAAAMEVSTPRRFRRVWSVLTD